MSRKSVKQECQQRVSRKECQERVSSKSVKKECRARECFQECPARRCWSLMTVRVIPTKKRHVFSFLRSFLCTLLYIKWLHSGSWVLSVFFLTKTAGVFGPSVMTKRTKLANESKDKCRSTKVSAWEMAKTAAERVRLPQQPLQKHPNSSYNNSRPIKSASFSWDDTPSPFKCLL